MVDNGFIHPLPPSGYSHLSQGESQLRNTAPANCPPETGGRAKRRGWIVSSSVLCTLFKGLVFKVSNLSTRLHKN